MSVDDYLRGLARQPAAAAVLITDETDRALLVKPTYKPQWEIPGGVIEEGETPWEAAVRELKEELGLPCVATPRLLCMDWMRTEAYEPGGPRMIFDGGTITPQELAAIQLPPDELSEWQLVAMPDIDRYAPPPLARRTRAAMAALTRETVYLENGFPIS
jgi:8-oxo-dGTP pyrophosphatase MutT (NUDIX family)